MKNENNSYRVRTGVGIDAPSHIDVKLDQTFEFLNILSLKIGQKNLYKMPASNYGIICGRVLANKTFGIPNARVSVFIPSENSVFDVKDNILYNYSTVNSSNMDGIRYNLLPSSSNNDCHQTVGSMYEKEFVLDNNDVIKIFDKYYTYTTRTNNAGDYMIYGIPVGRQMLHVDVDLSDIGELSIRPYDMIYKGYNVNQFESPNKFRRDKNLNRLPQIFTQDKGVYVYPFWGDTSDDDTNASITRCDIEIDYKFEPTCVFMGSIISDTGSASISHKCVPDDKVGKMSELITGEGRIEMIRKTFDGKVEEFSVMGNRLIDGNGVWCYQIPMNLDYVRTDEFGNIVPTDNPDTGIPTRARVRFRISMDEPGTDDTARKRARFLVPNNPRIDGKDNGIYPEFNKSEKHEPDYEFGSRTKEESYRDLFWNNVYTVKSYIPRLQKKRSPASRKFTGFKMINHFGDNNPLPYNNLHIRMGFVYRFLCSLLTMFIVLVASLNTVIATIGYILLGLAYSLDVLGYIFGVVLSPLIWLIRVFKGEEVDDVSDLNIFSKLTCPIYGAIPKMFIQISNLCEEDTMVFVPGAGAWLRGCITAACKMRKANHCVNNQQVTISSRDSEDLIPQEISINEDGDVDKNEKEKADLCELGESQWTTEIDSLLNCVQNELVQDNDVTSFNFQDDWINGVLYAPLWYRKIRPKRKVFFGLIQIGGSDVWCDSESRASKPSRQSFKLYNTCTQKRDLDTQYKIQPLDKDTKKSVDSQCSNNKCHRQKTYFRVNKGVIVRKETKLGEFVYYYRSVEYDEKINISQINNEAGDVKLLFATDIVLLGNLRECNSLGIPQFFKHLESTTYKMPPDLVSVDYEGKDEDNPDLDSENEYTGTAQDWHTEFTGADWGNSGVDQNYNKENSRYQERGDGIKDGDNKEHDNGGLFYGINCAREYVKPKSCINLSRICEFGVSLDQSILFMSSENNEGTQMPPDGFMSYDEIYNMDARSMFATMNSNALRTVVNPQTGFPVYRFNTLYTDNFDGSLQNLMSDIPQVNDGNIPILYHNNNFLEVSSEAYLRFRYGFLPNTNDFGVTFYQTNDEYRFPRYENSFYFYFGLKEGKTAIDKFRSTYYAECSNESDSESVLRINYQPNSWCANESDNKDDLDGYVNLDLSDLTLPITLSIKDELTNEEIANITLRNKGYKFYIGQSNPEAVNGGYYCLNNEFPNGWNGLRNGVYTIYITDGEDNQQQETINFQAPKLDCDLSVTNFVGDVDVIGDMINLSQPPYCDILESSAISTNNTLERMIGGYITIESINNSTNPDYEIEIKKDGADENEPCSRVVYHTVDNSITPPNAFKNPTSSTPSLPRIIGVSEPNRYYIVTIREKCGDTYLHTNEFSQKVYVAAETEFKMYVNDVDYDLIQNFDTGYRDDEHGGDILDNGNISLVEGWLDFASGMGPLHELELPLASLPSTVSDLKNPSADCKYTLTDEYYFDEAEFFEDNLTLYDSAEDFQTSPDPFGRVVNTANPLGYDYYERGNLNPLIGFNIDYYYNGVNDEGKQLVLDALNEVIAKRLELLGLMRKAFYLTNDNGSKDLTVTANKTPFNTLMYYVEDIDDPDDNVAYGEYEDLDIENHEDNTKNSISIPTIEYDYTNDCIVFRIICNNQHKRPYYVGVRSQRNVTVPNLLGINSNGGFTPGANMPPLHSVDMMHMFGIHIIDKIPTFAGIVWQPMVEYPIYGATTQGYQGAYMTMDGLIAGHLYNMFSTSNNRNSAEFVTQQLGNEDVEFYTVTVRTEDGVTPDEYHIPTTRYIYNEREYSNNQVNDLYNQYLNYSIGETTTTPADPWRQQYMSVRSNSNTLYIRDVDDTFFTFPVNILNGRKPGFDEDTVIEQNDATYLKGRLPESIGGYEMIWYVRTEDNPIYGKFMNNSNITPSIMDWDAQFWDTGTINISKCYFIGLSNDSNQTYRVVTPTYEVVPIDVQCSENSNSKLQITINNISNNCYYLRYYNFNVYAEAQKITSQDVAPGTQTIDTEYSWSDYQTNNPTLYIKDVTGIRRKLNLTT